MAENENTPRFASVAEARSVIDNARREFDAYVKAQFDTAVEAPGNFDIKIKQTSRLPADREAFEEIKAGFIKKSSTDEAFKQWMNSDKDRKETLEAAADYLVEQKAARKEQLDQLDNRPMITDAKTPSVRVEYGDAPASMGLREGTKLYLTGARTASGESALFTSLNAEDGRGNPVMGSDGKQAKIVFNTITVPINGNNIALDENTERQINAAINKSTQGKEGFMSEDFKMKLKQEAGSDTVTAELPQSLLDKMGEKDAKLVFSGKKTGDSVTFDKVFVSGRDGKNPIEIGMTTPATAKIVNGEAIIDDQFLEQVGKNAGPWKDKLDRVKAELANTNAAEDKNNGGRGTENGGRGGDGTPPKEKDFMESAGDFANDNKYALGAGLMVGLLGAAMGGGILGLILGLVAALVIGGLMGMGKGGSNEAGGPKRDEKEKGKGKAKEADGPAPTKGAEKAINVREDEGVQMVKKEPGKTTYLSGKDENGMLQYSDEPQEITLRTLNDKNEVTGFIKGKANKETEQFEVSKTAGILSDGRAGPEATVDVKASTTGGMLYLSDREDLKPARAAGAELAKTYATAQGAKLEPGAGDAVSLTLKDKDGQTVTMTGTLIDGGKEAVFTKAIMPDMKAKDGKPMQIDLPEKELQKLPVKDGTVSVMQGDVDKLAAGVDKKKGELQNAVVMAMQAGAMITGSTVMSVGTAPKTDATAVVKDEAKRPEMDMEKLKQQLSAAAGSMGNVASNIADGVADAVKDMLGSGVSKASEAGNAGRTVESQQTAMGDAKGKDKEGGRGG